MVNHVGYVFFLVTGGQSHNGMGCTVHQVDDGSDELTVILPPRQIFGFERMGRFKWLEDISS
jgi:hypothetical protein